MSKVITINNLVDIRDISVDKDLPKNERITEYIRQIRNPYHFRCGEFTITEEFDPLGPPLEKCLQSLV